MKVAILFPGQGVQSVGMAEDIIGSFKVARDVFSEATEVLGKDILDLVLSGPEEELNKTNNTQPAILTVTRAITEVFKESFKTFDVTAGLSLGEYSSLVFSGALSFKEALPLVEKRGNLMINALPLGEDGLGSGKMAAVLGAKRDELVSICDQITLKGAGYFVAPANFNSLDQIVISGEIKGVDLAGSELEALGVKVIPLNVAAPFHTPLLLKASQGLKEELEKINIKSPQIPMYFNSIGRRESDPLKIKELLTAQVMSPVLWVDTMIDMLENGVDTFIEVGPGKTLSGFLKRMPYDYQVYQVNNMKTLEKTLSKLGG